MFLQPENIMHWYVFSTSSYCSKVVIMFTLQPEEVNTHLDNLVATRSAVIENLRQIKFRIMETETQQSESVREVSSIFVIS